MGWGERLRRSPLLTTEPLPSGRTPVEALREAADYWDDIDRLAHDISITGGPHDGETLADVLGTDPEVQDDLRALADRLESGR